MPLVLNVGDAVQRARSSSRTRRFAVFQVSDAYFEVFPNARVVFREKPSSWRTCWILLGRVKVHIRSGRQPNYNRSCADCGDFRARHVFEYRLKTRRHHAGQREKQLRATLLRPPNVS